MAVPVKSTNQWHHALTQANGALTVGALGAALVLMATMERDGSLRPERTPGLVALGRKMGYGAANRGEGPRKHLRELEAAGYLLVTWRRGRGQTHHYRAAIPDSVASGHPEWVAESAVIRPDKGDGGSRAQSAVIPPHNPASQPTESAVIHRPRKADSAVNSPEKCGRMTAHSPLVVVPELQIPPLGEGLLTQQHREGREHADCQVVFRQVVARLHDLGDPAAQTLGPALSALDRPDLVVHRISELYRAGHGAAVVRALTTNPLYPGSSAYSGAEAIIGRTAAARIRDLHRKLFGTPGPDLPNATHGMDVTDLVTCALDRMTTAAAGGVR